jgi:hypothetical protein
MKTKDILMFAAVAMVVGTIVSMSTAGIVAAQTVDSSNNDNINTNNCQEINPGGVNSDSATAAVSNREIGGTDDADEPGDVDVNDEEDMDSGSEDAEEEDDDGTDDADEPGDVDVNDEEDMDSGSEDAGQGITQFESQIRGHIEGACTALQNNDIQGALVHIDLALNMLGGDTATSVGSGAVTNSTIVGASEGGSEGIRAAGGGVGNG